MTASELKLWSYDKVFNVHKGGIIGYAVQFPKNFKKQDMLSPELAPVRAIIDIAVDDFVAGKKLKLRYPKLLNESHKCNKGVMNGKMFYTS